MSEVKVSKWKYILCCIRGHRPTQVNRQCSRCGYTRFLWWDGIEYWRTSHPYIDGLVVRDGRAYWEDK